ncbi:hypothetical protein, partial [Endozoicomonas acroporae]|uniref:hypothetical protein n=1 Tax=Endozoicomonas acroporae TaxID=1701104 RepID=UPI0015E06827
TLASSFQYANSKTIYFINDTETLLKIGQRDSGFPEDGIYQQTANINVNESHIPIGTFTGEYDGQCYTISGLFDCFVNTLKGNISDLKFTRANIKNSTKVTGLAACVVEKSGTVSNIWAENVHIVSLSDSAHVGIGGGQVKGKVTNIMAVNSNVITKGKEASAGIGGGEVKAGGKVDHTTAVNCHVTTKGNY